MSHYLNLLRLRNIINRSRINIICKSKKYLKAGQKPPSGVKLHKGPRGGTYYNTEDVHKVKGTTPKKRLPAFRKQEDGSVMHRTKTGQHGPGAYRIESKDGEHHLSFEGKGGVKSLGKHTDIRELKRQVEGFKTGGKKEAEAKLNETPPASLNEMDALLAEAQSRFNTASNWWRQKYPDPESTLNNAEKARLKELREGNGPVKIENPVVETEPELEPVPPVSPIDVKVHAERISYEKELGGGYGKIESRLVNTDGEDLFTEIITPSGKSFLKPNDATVWMNVWVQPDGKKTAVWEGVSPGVISGRITDNISAMKKMEKKGSSSDADYRNRIIKLALMGRIVALSKKTQEYLNINGVKPAADITETKTHNYPEEVYQYNELPDWTQNGDGSYEVPIIEQFKVLKSELGEHDLPSLSHSFETVYTSGKLGSYVVRGTGKKTQTLYYKSPDGVETPMHSHMKGNDQNYYGYHGKRSTTKSEIDSYIQSYAEREAEKQKAKDARKGKPRVMKDKSQFTLFKSIPDGIAYIEMNCKHRVKDMAGCSIESLHTLALFLSTVESKVHVTNIPSFQFGTVRGARNVATYSGGVRNVISIKKGNTWVDDAKLIERNNQTAERNAEGVPWHVDATGMGTLWHEYGHWIDHMISNQNLRRHAGEWFALASSDEVTEAHKLSQYARHSGRGGYWNSNIQKFCPDKGEYIAEAITAIMMGSDRTKYIPKPVYDNIITHLKAINLSPEDIS